MLELRYPLFDGQRVWEGACVTVDGGVIVSMEPCDPASCQEGFLLPGLIDAHVHMGTAAHVQAMLKSGVTTVCDVSASKELIAASRRLSIVGSAGMAMGVVLSPKSYVEQAAANGASYIKVLLFSPLSIGKSALCGIVREAHERGLKVAVHATETATIRQAVDAEADILLHVPMKEALPMELAEEIAQKGMAVAPTLVMMETFAQSGKNGYRPHQYENARQAVKTLHDAGVTILAGTDANPGAFAPAVGYGDTLHKELALLVEAGLTPVEALTAATGNVGKAFRLQAGRLLPGQPADIVLVSGRPDRHIAHSRQIQALWVKGEALS